MSTIIWLTLFFINTARETFSGIKDVYDCGKTFTMKNFSFTNHNMKDLERLYHSKKSWFLTSSAYLKKPEHIEALLMIMNGCLMVYMSLVHKIWKELKQKLACFLVLKYKPTQTYIGYFLLSRATSINQPHNNRDWLWI